MLRRFERAVCARTPVPLPSGRLLGGFGAQRVPKGVPKWSPNVETIIHATFNGPLERFWLTLGGPSKISVSCKRGAHFKNIGFFMFGVFCQFCYVLGGFGEPSHFGSQNGTIMTSNVNQKNE